jgi:hypothetical protein
VSEQQKPQYRVKPGCLALIKDPTTGRIVYHYGAVMGRGSSAATGPIIPWISDEQRDHLLRHNIIERIDDHAPDPYAAGERGADEPLSAGDDDENFPVVNA